MPADPRGAPGRVAVVVVTYNSADVVPGLLASLPAGLGGLDWTLVVVDNGSRDGTVEVVERLAPDAVVVRSARNGGYAAGINLGAAQVPDRSAVLVLNPDVRLGPGCVPELVAALGRTGAGIVVPRLDDAGGTLISSRRREPTLRRALADAVLGAERAGSIARPGRGRSPTPATTRPRRRPTGPRARRSSSRAACWDAVGPWDESYFLYSEETDFALRARDAGLPHVVRPDRARRAPRGRLGRQPRRCGGCWSPTGCGCTAAGTVAVATAAFWVVLSAARAAGPLLGKQTSRAALRGLLSPRYLRQTPGPAQHRARSAPALEQSLGLERRPAVHRRGDERRLDQGLGRVVARHAEPRLEPRPGRREAPVGGVHGRVPQPAQRAQRPAVVLAPRQGGLGRRRPATAAITSRASTSSRWRTSGDMPAPRARGPCRATRPACPPRRARRPAATSTLPGRVEAAGQDEERGGQAALDAARAGRSRRPRRCRRRTRSTVAATSRSRRGSAGTRRR